MNNYQVNDMVQVSFDWGPKEQYNGPGRVLALPSPDMPFYRIRVVEADGTAYDWSLRESEIRPLVVATPVTGPGATAAYFDKKHDQGKRDWTLLPVKGLSAAIRRSRERAPDDYFASAISFSKMAEHLVAWRDRGDSGALVAAVADILEAVGVHGALDGVMQVLEFGAKKYAKDSWRTVPDARDRYYSAAWRHLERMEEPGCTMEAKDEESGLHHEYHLLCNLLFLLDLSA